MGNIKEIQHDLRRDFYNMISLLKFIKEEEEITKDTELSTMLKMCLERETETIERLDHISKFLLNGKNLV